MSTRQELRRASVITRAGVEAQRKAVALHERNWQAGMEKCLVLYKREFGYEWGEPETLNQMALTEWLEDKADAYLAERQGIRLNSIHRAISRMQAGGYVRPSRLSGRKLGLGE